MAKARARQKPAKKQPRSAAAASAATASTKVRILTACLVAAVAFAVYANTLSAPFLYDDHYYVAQNPQIQDLSNLPGVFLSSYPPGAPEQGLYRPITVVTYALDAALHGVKPAAFHWTNVLLHVVTSTLVFFVLLGFRTGAIAAAAGAIVFAVHPVHTEAVSWVVGRAEVLAGLFACASLLFYMRYRAVSRVWLLVLSVVCYLVALGSKEIAAGLPAVLLVGEALGLFGPSERKERIRRYALISIVFGVAFFAYCGLRVAAIGRFGMLVESTVFITDPPGTRPATVLAAIFRYARLCLVPTGLRLDYADLKSSGFSPQVLLGLLTVAALATAAWIARRRAPRVSLAIAWFALFLLPITNVVMPIGAVFAERFLYVASVAVAILVAETTCAIARRRQPVVRYAALAVGVAVALVFTVGTWQRNRVWADEERFWRAAVEQSPGTEKPYLNFYYYLNGQGRAEEAEEILRAGAGLRPLTAKKFTVDHIYLLFELAKVHLNQERHEDALVLFDRVVYICGFFQEWPDRIEMEVQSHFNRGVAMSALENPEGALAAFDQALARRPNFPLALLNAGRSLRQMEDFEGALERYEKAVQIAPNVPVMHVDLGITLRALGRDEEAVDAFATALRLGDMSAIPQLYAATNKLYNDAVAANDLERALAVLDECTRVAPMTGEYAYGMGFLSERLGDREGAMRYYRQALELNPDEKRARAALDALRTSPATGGDDADDG